MPVRSALVGARSRFQHVFAVLKEFEFPCGQRRLDVLLPQRYARVLLIRSGSGPGAQAIGGED